VKASHKVQSVRAVVEQTFVDLKQWKIMESNKIKTADDFEKILDCVIALHNFKVLVKSDPKFDIPVRRAAIPGEHIFRPNLPEKEVDLKIPANPSNLDLPKYAHIHKFQVFLASAAPDIEKALERGGKEAVFLPTVMERGRNLCDGAYVLQVRFQDEGLDLWTVKYLVGASYSYETHSGYFQISKLNAAMNHICDCLSG
jgi:hypothetical protein